MKGVCVKGVVCMHNMCDGCVCVCRRGERVIEFIVLPSHHLVVHTS